jgi:hypothetical protein
LFRSAREPPGSNAATNLSPRLPSASSAAHPIGQVVAAIRLVITDPSTLSAIRGYRFLGLRMTLALALALAQVVTLLGLAGILIWITVQNGLSARHTGANCYRELFAAGVALKAAGAVLFAFCAPGSVKARHALAERAAVRANRAIPPDPRLEPLAG